MNRIHHDDEGRIFLHDGQGQVWRMLIRDEGASRAVEFRSATGSTMSCGLSRKEDAEISDAEVVELFRRAANRARS